MVKKTRKSTQFMFTPSRKILLYTHAMTGGGAERVWALLASELSRRGHDILFVTDFSAIENNAFLSDRLRQIVLPLGHYGAVIGLAKLIKREKPDITISALGVSNFKHVIAAFIAGTQGRAIISMHGYYSSEPGILSRIGNAFTPLLSRITAASICVSDGLLNYFVKNMFLPRSKATRIYNPVMLKVNRPLLTRGALKARAPIILSVGRLVDYKNHTMLVRAFAKLDDKKAVLKILGEGPDSAKIEQLSRNLGVSERVQLLGYHDAPWQFYAEAKCFALPSRSESFGNVVVEALGQGLPVISTKCHGPLEIISDTLLGTLVDIDDVDAMTSALNASLLDPGDPTPRIKHAQKFTCQAAAQAYENVFEEVIKKSQFQ